MWIDSETLGKPGHWRMYYRGGWSTGAIGMATSPDGRVWSKRKGPVYGLNGSGFAGSAMQPWVLRVTPLDFTHAANVTSDNGGGSSNSNPRYPSWWLFTSSWQGSSRMNIATSENGVDWTTNASARVPLPEGKSLFGNRAVWTDSTTKAERHLAGGSLEWTMLQEVGPAPWEIYVYTSRDGFDWVLGNSGGKPLRDLQRHSGGMYGGPSLANVDGKTSPKDTNGTYHLWYHASSASGDLPTDIYHASSEDLINWVVSPAGPVLLHGGAGTFEYDQVADPSPVVAGEHVMLFYDGDNNVNGSAAIGGAVFDRHRAATVLGKSY